MIFLGYMACSCGGKPCQNLHSDLAEVLENISKDTRDLLIGNHVKTYSAHMDPIEFLRDHLGCSQPCLVRNEEAVQLWPASTRWINDDYLLQKLDDVSVTTALTPDGLADCPQHSGRSPDTMQTTFALPYYLQMPFRRFYEILSQKNESVVPYLQQQNSSLTTELSVLLDDVGNIPWADECFKNLEALNFWMGKYPTKTSWHRDHFENLYVVLRGCKVVRLLPPTDSYRMKVKAYGQSTWSTDDSFTRWTLKPNQDNALLWSSLMPCTCLETRADGMCSSCKHLYPRLPLEVEVHAGDVLYIPATWYHEIHHKETEESTIAINFWYDMIHDSKYSSMVAVDKIAQILNMNESL